MYVGEVQVGAAAAFPAHLDVYKRQVPCNLRSCGQCGANEPPYSGTSDKTDQASGDVYKRQLHTNYEGKAEAAVKVLTEDGYDFAYVHVEAPDEMGHQGSVEKKVKAIENLDERVIRPIVQGMGCLLYTSYRIYCNHRICRADRGTVYAGCQLFERSGNGISNYRLA